MIMFKDLKFGDDVFVVHIKNNAFAKKRITMTDEHGIEWSRYDRDHWEYSIEQIQYCGKVSFVEEGEVRFNEERETEYHFSYPNGQIHPSYQYDDMDDWFCTREEAEQHIEELKRQNG